MIQLAILVAVLLTFDFPCAAAEPDWRPISRQARMALEHQNFSEAEHGYKTAIAILERQKDGEEVVTELELALVEAYRRQGNLVEARPLLDRIGNKIQTETLADPLIEERYWQRRSALQESMGDRPGAAESFHKAYIIFGRYFDHDSQTYLAYWATLLQKLCLGGQWETVTVELRELKSNHDIRQLPAIQRATFNGACLATESAVLDLAKTGELDRAGKLLSDLSTVCNDHQKIFELWRVWCNRCFEMNQPAKAALAIKSIRTLQESLISSHSTANIHAAITGCYCLSSIYGHRNETDLILDQYKQMSGLIVALGPRATPEESMLQIKTLQEAVASIYATRRLDDDAKRIVQMEVRLTTLPKNLPPSPSRSRAGGAHCFSRQTLAYLLARRNELVGAVDVLSGISPQAMNQTGNAMIWQFRVHHLLASVYSKMGDLPQSTKQLGLANSYFTRVTLSSTEKDKLRQSMNEMTQLITPDRALLITTFPAGKEISLHTFAVFGASWQ